MEGGGEERRRRWCSSPLRSKEQPPMDAIVPLPDPSLVCSAALRRQAVFQRWF